MYCVQCTCTCMLEWVVLKFFKHDDVSFWPFSLNFCVVNSKLTLKLAYIPINVISEHVIMIFIIIVVYLKFF